jgi:hypothetical protein
VITLEARTALLKKVHLFRDLSNDELAYLADRFSEAEYAPGEVIIAQGTRGESFFLLFRGKVRVGRKKDNREEQLAVLVDNDYFGDMELISKRPRTASVIALEPVTALVLSKENFNELLQQNPNLKPTLDVAIRSRFLTNQLQLKWVQPDEVVYFLSRKHPVLLYDALGPPVLVLLGAIALAVWSVMTGAVTPAALGGILFVGDLGWAVWRVIDWSNDYYVVTNERVVWLEKVVGLYDSRQEAPLSTVLSVSVETDLWGRSLGYGNVIVRTFVGKIPFNHVPHPNQVAHIIEEYWQRAKASTTNIEKEAMRNAIRKKLGMAEVRTPGPGAQAGPKLKRSSVVLKALGANTLKIRYEIGDTVVYRKHWVVLLRQAGVPALFMVLLLGMFIRRMILLLIDPAASFLHRTATGGIAPDTLAITYLVLIIPFFLWMVYQIADWSNDIFQVTQDQIIDMDRKPFGTQERRAAQLENILATEYQRRGLIGNMFNFGTVYITVGGTQLAFEDVTDPGTVQSDIDRRRMVRMAKVNEAKVAGERDRMAEWLAAYNENADEFRPASGRPPKTE